VNPERRSVLNGHNFRQADEEANVGGFAGRGKTQFADAL
jgi:hypothetical protein